MNQPSRLGVALAPLAIVALAACYAKAPRPTMVSTRTGPQATASAVPAARPGTDSGRPRYTDADVRFMQGMIAHHAQAVRMSRLVPTRSGSRDLRVLAKRVRISQRDEIAMMQDWLRKRDQWVPHPTLAYPPEAGSATSVMKGMPGMSMHAADGGLMPGMLTRVQMERLAAASGTEFDRFFLEGMIRHHRGALVMVENLFGTRGAAQAPLVFELANEIGAVQRSQITSMRALLAALPASALER